MDKRFLLEDLIVSCQHIIDAHDAIVGYGLDLYTGEDDIAMLREFVRRSSAALEGPMEEN